MSKFKYKLLAEMAIQLHCMENDIKNNNNIEAGNHQICKCDDSIKPHSCPYKRDIDGDYTTLCTCCELCENECNQDI